MAFVGSAGQFNTMAQNQMGTMGAGMKQAAEGRLALAQEIAPPDNEKAKEGEAGGGGLAGLMKATKGGKDVYKGYQKGKQVISDAQDTITKLQGQANNAISQVQGGLNRISPATPPARGVPAPQGGTPQGLDRPSPITESRGGVTPPNAKQGLVDKAQEHNDTLSQMSDGDKASTMASMEADPVAGGNFKATGMAYNDRVGVLNARSNIIGDAVDDINTRTAQSGGRLLGGLVANSGQDVSGGMRVGQSLTGANAQINGALGQLNGNLRGAANGVVGQARGALANTANNVHGAIQGASQGVSQAGEDIAGGIAKAQGVVDAGMETAGSVLDALGPIGDILGVGMTIFGAIDDAVTHHKAEEGATAAEAQVSQPTPTAAAQQTTATLDTSKISQASASAHF